MSRHIINGNVDVKRVARVKPSAVKTWDWKPNRKDKANRPDILRDKYKRETVSRFAPELVQAAKQLGIHPAQLEKRLSDERKLNHSLNQLKEHKS